MNEDIYKTKNLYVAAYLQVKKIEFIGLQELDPKTKLFIFKPYRIAKRLEQEYYNGGVLSAVSFVAEYNNLKDMLFSDQTRREF